MGELTDPSSREYGEERPGDRYEQACVKECRLGCFDHCVGRGACRLEVTPDRPSRAVSAYLDNRRGVIRYMADSGHSQVTIRTNNSDGLPQNDPVTVWGTSLKDPDCPDPTPYYEMRAENVPCGTHRITLASLNARIEDYAPKKGKKA